MVDLVLGIAAAAAASTFYSLGIALQALDARETPDHEHLRLALVWGLLRRMRWLAGTGLSILGFPLQVLALMLAPLVVVQPALAAGLLVLMLLGERILGEPAGRYEYVAVSMIVAGVVGAGLTAPPRSTMHSEELTITLVLVGLGAASLIPYLMRALGRSNAVVTMVGAGLAFGWSAVATKLASDDLAIGHLLPAAAWGLSTAAASLVGVLGEMSSLQSRPAIQVAPVVFVTQTLVPVVLAPILLGESFSRTPLSGVPLGISLALLVTGAALLARSPLLLALMDGEAAGPGGTRATRIPEPTSEASGSTPSPADASRETIRSSPASPAGEPPISTTSTSPARTPR